MADYPGSPVTQTDVSNTASGLIFATVFGAAWAFSAASALHGVASPWPLIVTVAIGVFLISRGVRLRRTATTLQADGDIVRIRRRTHWFRVIFVLELALIAVGIFVCNATGHSALSVPVAVFIVGLHFFPLAVLFRNPTFYATGCLLCLLVILTMVVFPSHATVDHTRVSVWWSIVGFGAAIILWATAIRSWLRGRALLRRARQSSAGARSSQLLAHETVG